MQPSRLRVAHTAGRRSRPLPRPDPAPTSLRSVVRGRRVFQQGVSPSLPRISAAADYAGQAGSTLARLRSPQGMPGVLRSTSRPSPPLETSSAGSLREAQTPGSPGATHRTLLKRVRSRAEPSSWLRAPLGLRDAGLGSNPRRLYVSEMYDRLAISAETRRMLRNTPHTSLLRQRARKIGWGRIRKAAADRARCIGDPRRIDLDRARR